MFNKYKKLCVSLLSFFTTLNAFSQETTKLSAELSFGIPATFFSVNSKSSGIYQLGWRYSLNKNFSFGGRLTSKNFSAETTNPTGVVSTDGVYAKDISNYKNSFIDLGAYAQYNLGGLFGLNKPNTKFMPYATLGAALQFWKLNTTLIDGRQSAMTEYGDKPMRNYQFGLGLRYYLNPNIDLFFSSEYNYVESYWVDGAYGDKKLDTYLNNSFGLSYKIGAKQNKNLADWGFKNKPIDEVAENQKKDYAKWSADLSLGIPYMFSPVGYNLTGMGGIGLRYSFTKIVSLALQYDLASLSGSQSTNSTVLDGSALNPKNVKEFSTFATLIGLDMRLNLRNIFKGEPENLNKWNHYYVGGFGFMSYRNDNTLVNGNTTSLDYPLFGGKGAAVIGTRYLRIGYEARKHLNNKFDVLGNILFNRVESYWIDGAGEERTLRNQIVARIGISYKFGCKGTRELIDWSNKNYSYSKNPREVAIENIPVIDKSKVVDVPKVEPKIDPIVVPVPEPVIPKVEPIVVPVPEPVIPKVEPIVVPVPEPVVPEPVVPKVEPIVVPVPKPVVPKVEPIVVPVPKPVKPKVEPVVVTKPVVAENKEEVTEPDNMYNVVVGCYGLSHLDLAMKFRDSLRQKGYKANVYRSLGSNLYRVMTTSSNDKGSALQILKQSKVEIDPQSWFYLYNKQ